MSYDDDDVTKMITGNGHPAEEDHPWGSGGDPEQQEGAHQDEHGGREPGFNYGPDAVAGAAAAESVPAKKSGGLKTLLILVLLGVLLFGFVGFVLVKALHLGQHRRSSDAPQMMGAYGGAAGGQPGAQPYPGQAGGNGNNGAGVDPGTGATGRDANGPGVFDAAPNGAANGAAPSAATQGQTGQTGVQTGVVQSPGQSGQYVAQPATSGTQASAQPMVPVVPVVPTTPASTQASSGQTDGDGSVSAQLSALSAQVSQLASAVAALTQNGANSAAAQPATQGASATSAGHAQKHARRTHTKDVDAAQSDSQSDSTVPAVAGASDTSAAAPTTTASEPQSTRQAASHHGHTRARRSGSASGAAGKSVSIDGYSLKAISPARDGESSDRATVVEPDGTTVDVHVGSSIGGTTVTGVDADAGVVHTPMGDIQ